MNKLLSLFALISIVVVISCQRAKETEPEQNKIDSLVSKFTWSRGTKGQIDSNILYLNQLLTDKNAGTVAKFKIYSQFCGYYYLLDRNLPKAMAYADSMVLIIEKSDPERYAKELAQGYYSKGDILFALGRYDASFDYYHQAKNIMAANKDNCTNSDYSYRIGMVLYKQGKYANAGYFFNQGFDESADCLQDFPKIFRRQELLNNAALCYSKLGESDSAIIAYNRALKYINQNDTLKDTKAILDVARGVVYGNIGGEYFVKKDYVKAEGFLLKSIAINARPGYENRDAALTQAKLAKLYLETNRIFQMGQTLMELKKSIDITHYADAEIPYHLLMSKYLEKLGRKDEAYDHMAIFTAMTDSAQKQLSKMKATDINERFRNLDSQNEIDYLKRERELQTTYLYITVVFSVMAIAIILLIYFYWKKSKKNIRILTELNNQVSSQKQQLEATLRDLETSNKEKDSILRAVAHDLRNPIGGIASLVGLIIEDEKDEEAVLKHKLIKDTCVSALNLINELIEASENRDKSNITDKRSATDLEQLVSNAVELLRFKAKEKHQEINFVLPESPVVLSVNREKIFRVISNLISNAIKFSQENKLIEVRMGIKNNQVLVEVIDQGIGIPEHLHGKLFQVFTSAKRAGTNGEKSYGLGLSICKQIVEAHNGEIGYRPLENGGSDFYFTLPI